MDTHALIALIRKNPHMSATPSEKKTAPVKKRPGWFKPIGKVKLPSPTPPAQVQAVRRAQIDRNQRANLARVVEEFNKHTREVGPSGRRNQGAIKASGVDVLKALMFDYYNLKTGQADPSDATLAEATGWSVRTVGRSRRRLRESGLLSWVRRSIWRDARWHPFSNAYSFGQLGVQTTIRNIKVWGERVAASPSELLLGLVRRFGVTTI